MSKNLKATFWPELLTIISLFVFYLALHVTFLPGTHNVSDNTPWVYILVGVPCLLVLAISWMHCFDTFFQKGSLRIRRLITFLLGAILFATIFWDSVQGFNKYENFFSHFEYYLS